MARLEAVKANGMSGSVVFQRLTDADKPETLREIAKAWKVPVGRFVEWFATEHAELYEAALKVLADQDANEVVAIADGAAPETVQVSKLRAEVRKWRASKWDRDRYGDKTDVRHTGMIPTLVIEIAAEEPQPRVIDGTVVEPEEPPI